MNAWRNKILRPIAWKGALPGRLGIENVSVHLSTLVALVVAAFVLAVISLRSEAYAEMRTAIVTLPIVWLVSLFLRTTAQFLAIGSHGDQFEIVVGPAGNISNDYEHLSGPAMLSYSVAGQSATLLFGLMGLLVLGSVVPTPATGLTLASVLDFRCGLDFGAWASQVVWVNIFLFTLHLLPATPFDARALVVGWCRVSQPQMPHYRVHRMLASTDSHLAFALAGVALAMIVTRINSLDSVLIWYALLFVSIFLLTVSQYETFQAHQEEAFAEPPVPQIRRRDPASSMNVKRQSTLLTEYSGLTGYAQQTDASSTSVVVDVDEILRKLHREGRDSLSDIEKETLMNASRELKARRKNS